MSIETSFQFSRKEKGKENDKGKREDYRRELEEKRKLLSTLAYFIGKDFHIPVELNTPGAGWHWDFKHNVIRIDPEDLILEIFNEKRRQQGLRELNEQEHMDYLRFVISHEAGHRRITRADFIPEKVWNQEGFPFLMNAIEDPRDNNFVADAYPLFRDQMKLAYEDFLNKEEKGKEEAKERLGHTPRFMQAGFEYIRQWFREREGADFHISDELPDEVKSVVEKTLSAAQDAWWTYPEKREADDPEQGEDLIRKYAQASYRIIHDRIWPEFKKLIEQDKRDQELEEFLKEIQEKMRQGQSEEQESSGGKTSQEGEQGEESDRGGGADERNGEDDRDGKESGDTANEDGEQQEEKANGEGKEEESSRGKQTREQEGTNGENGGTDEQREDGGEKGDRKENSEEQARRDGIPSELKESLSEEELRELEEALRDGNSHEEGKQEGKAIDLDQLSESLKEKLRDYLDSLPEEEKREIAEKAEASLRAFEEELRDELESKLSERRREGSPDEESFSPEEEGEGAERKEKQSDKDKEVEDERTFTEEEEERLNAYRDMLKQVIERDANVYEKYRREVIPIIQRLEHELADIFDRRKRNAWQTKLKRGKKIDIKRRMQEQARDIPVIESRAWKRREAPQERDYAITLLVDLSGSMRGKKIKETFKGVIALAEVLNRFSIKTEVLGFNDTLYEYKTYQEEMSDEIRSRMGSMLQEVYSPGAVYNDDGWAVEQASERLEKVKGAQEKFLIVLSDGLPEESDKHPGSRYPLKKMIRDAQEREQKVIGVGIGPNTEHVENYYPNSIANIHIQEFPEKLSHLLREVIENYQSF